MILKLDNVVCWWRAPQQRLIAPVMGVAWQAMLFSRLMYATYATGTEDNSMYVGMVGILMVLSCLLMFVRYRWPLAVCGVESLITIAAGLLAAPAYVVAGLYLCLFAVVARSSWRTAFGGLAMSAGACVIAAVLTGNAPLLVSANIPAPPADVLIPVMTIWLVIAIAGAFSHMRYDQRMAAAELQKREAVAAAERAALMKARDEALRRGSVAANLHDSVGHDLTAIIALSEGLAQSTGDEILDGALASINELARSGLADTRSAVRQLSRVQMADEQALSEYTLGEQTADECTALNEDTPEVEVCPLHSWDDLSDVFDTTRQLGIRVVMTETGRRSDDTAEADLAFCVSREAITNAIRHGHTEQGASVQRITISWDHRADGSCAVTIRDNGASSPEESLQHEHEGAFNQGTGLARLRERVELSGGTFKAGWTSQGWCVQAVIPHVCRKGASHD